MTPFLYELFGQPKTFIALKDRELWLDHADFSEQKECSQLATKCGVRDPVKTGDDGL